LICRGHWRRADDAGGTKGAFGQLPSSFLPQDVAYGRAQGIDMFNQLGTHHWHDPAVSTHICSQCGHENFGHGGVRPKPARVFHCSLKSRFIWTFN
jgi:hypothetical protein